MVIRGQLPRGGRLLSKGASRWNEHPHSSLSRRGRCLSFAQRTDAAFVSVSRAISAPRFCAEPPGAHVCQVEGVEGGCGPPAGGEGGGGNVAYIDEVAALPGEVVEIRKGTHNAFDEHIGALCQVDKGLRGNGVTCIGLPAGVSPRVHSILLPYISIHTPRTVSV
jgi:hypothetical protein